VRDRRFDSVDRICPFRRFVFMKHIVSVAAALVVMALASTGSAQVQTGSILVKATDEQGASTPGVTVTITSGVIVGGSQSGVTDVGGIYRFPSSGAGYLHGQARAAGVPDHHPREHPGSGRTDDADRDGDEGRE
jgi:hypothetical protein